MRKFACLVLALSTAQAALAMTTTRVHAATETTQYPTLPPDVCDLIGDADLAATGFSVTSKESGVDDSGGPRNADHCLWYAEGTDSILLNLFLFSSKGEAKRTYQLYRKSDVRSGWDVTNLRGLGDRAYFGAFPGEAGRIVTVRDQNVMMAIGARTLQFDDEQAMAAYDGWVRIALENLSKAT